METAAGTKTVVGNKTGLDINIAGSGGSLTATVQALSASSGNVSGVASSVSLAVANVVPAGNVQITLATSAFVGTLNFEASDDSGTTWYPVVAAREDGTGQDSILALNIGAAYSKMWVSAAGGITHYRVRCSSFTSGSITCRITPGPMLIEPNPIATVIPVDGNKQTYTAHIAAMAANIASDVFVVLGGSTRIIKVTRVDISGTVGGTALTSTASVISLIARNANDTGGTTAIATQGAVDSTAPARVGSAQGYTVAPTALGASRATIRAQRVSYRAAGEFSISWDFGNRPSQAPVIRGVAECLAINNSALVAGTSPTLTWSITVEWTEESL